MQCQNCKTNKPYFKTICMLNKQIFMDKFKILGYFN